MEATFTKFRTVVAIVAMILVVAAAMQTVAPASGEPARMHSVSAELLIRITVGAVVAAPTVVCEELREAHARMLRGKNCTLAIEKRQPLANQSKRRGIAPGTQLHLREIEACAGAEQHVLRRVGNG